MKVERKESEFRPVVITVETEEEYNYLLQSFRALSNWAFHYATDDVKVKIKPFIALLESVK